MFPAVVKSVMKNGFNVLNMKVTKMGHWKHGEEKDPQRLVLFSAVVEIPKPPEIHSVTRAGYVHYNIPELEKHGWPSMRDDDDDLDG